MPSPTSKTSATKNAPGKASSSKKKTAVRDRVLLVDDDKIIVDSLGELLRLEGYEVDGVYSVNQALDLIAPWQHLHRQDSYAKLRTIGGPKSRCRARKNRSARLLREREATGPCRGSLIAKVQRRTNRARPMPEH